MTTFPRGFRLVTLISNLLDPEEADASREIATGLRPPFLPGGRTERIPYADGSLDLPLDGLIYNGYCWVVCYESGCLNSYYPDGRLVASLPLLDRRGCLIGPVAVVYNYPRYQFRIRGVTVTAELLILSRNGTWYGLSTAWGPQPVRLPISDLTEGGYYLSAAVDEEGTLYMGDAVRGLLVLPVGGVLQDDWRDRDTVLPLPETYRPSSLTVWGETLIVGWSLYEEEGQNWYPVTRVGNGYLSQFRRDGVFLRRIASREWLNTPTSVYPTPSHWGYPVDTLLVSNWGNGLLSLCSVTGEYYGELTDHSFTPIAVGSTSCIYGEGRTVYLLHSEDGLRVSRMSSVVGGRQ